MAQRVAEDPWGHPNPGSPSCCDPEEGNHPAGGGTRNSPAQPGVLSEAQPTYQLKDKGKKA